jgi:hypothetical protein
LGIDQVYNTYDIANLAHLLLFAMKVGHSKDQLKNAEVQWTYEEISLMARGFKVSPEVAERMAYRVWHSLGVIDYNRKMAGLNTFYRK